VAKGSIFTRIEALEDQLRGLRDELKEARDDCRKIRTWVEDREADKERLSLGWWAAIIAGIAVFLSSVVTAIAQLAG
jgi:hypothetical protein